MRKRNHRIWCRLNDQEYAKYLSQVNKTGLSQESYLRKLITGCQIKEMPPVEYYKLIQELMRAGHNLNQIAAKANSLHLIDRDVYRKNVEVFWEILLQIQSAMG